MGPAKERLLREVLDLDESEATGMRIADLKAPGDGHRSGLQSNGRPRFDLADDKIGCSAETAMRQADAVPGDTTRPMKTREAAHALVDDLSDTELAEVVGLIVGHREGADKCEIAEMLEPWRKLPSGTPTPNWVTAVDEARQDD